MELPADWVQYCLLYKKLAALLAGVIDKIMLMYIEGKTKQAFSSRPVQCVEKARLRRSFPPGLRRPPTPPSAAPGGGRRKETLLRKASESTAHVAGFGMQLGGLRPSEPPKRVF